ncbi:C40 family peptidase [Hespellia stercorisuis]|uniref:Cell wall-associated hydrolase, NlpC family n=1 Tax=Hespellia stercorisuis DSM 15480 TaxID=1121950 RepID=A0A1M6P419_9FIRM|nr:C40 family peptidase [Hespellia stercorisuis]SHK02642.1 Cell wall-associated hydrolase, NlpC family [Hespellia stercorisuis DSM 15480]
MKVTYVRQRLIVTAVAGAIMIPGSAIVAHAEDAVTLPTAGIESVLEKCYLAEEEHPMELYLVPTEQEEYSNRAFADTQDYILIRDAPYTTSDWAGKLYKNNVADILDTQGAWTKISSGTVTGYVETEELLTGGAAKEYAGANIGNTATVTAYVLNVRDGQNTNANILTQITLDEKYQVTGDSVSGWYPVQVGDIAGWVCGDYVNVSPDFSYAESKQEEEQRLAAEKAEAEKAAAEKAAADKAAAEKTAADKAAMEKGAVQQAAGEMSAGDDVGQGTEEASAAVLPDQTGTSAGQAVIDYACQFIGNPYVWGGTSLTEGCDCSGFVQSVYAQFGVSLPRTTWDMESAGTEVSFEEAIPGDLILYDGHVGLYMGDGTIVNAIDSDHGIGISNATFTYIVTVRRVI